MLIRLGQPADHGFDSPLGLLSDCHRRIERFLAILAAVTADRRGGALGAGDRQALEAALGYFDTAAPRHTADEETSLFPRLRATENRAARAALDALRRLESDHRQAEAHHEVVSRLGRRWLSEGALPESDTQVLAERLTALQHLYRDHIAVEDHDVFPAAARALNSTDLETIGREMAERRGVAYPSPLWPGPGDAA